MVKNAGVNSHNSNPQHFASKYATSSARESLQFFPGTNT